MKTYIISYDMALGGNYNALHAAIESYGYYAPITDSTWAVLTEYSAQVIRDHLSKYLPNGSRLFVGRHGDEAAWQYVNCPDEWLKSVLSQDVPRLNKLLLLSQPD